MSLLQRVWKRVELVLPRYVYMVEIVSIYDADTVTADIEIVRIDLGFHVHLSLKWKKRKIRLYGINAYELRGGDREKGLAGRDWLRERWPTGTRLAMRSIKDKTGKYGRVLGVMFDGVESEDSAEIIANGVCVNDELVRLGHAIYKEY